MTQEENLHWKSIKKELIFAVRNDEVRKVYFLLAANLACIGYSVDKTIGMNLSLNLFWLGLSLFGFAYSTIIGLNYLDNLNQHRLKEAENIDAQYSDSDDLKELLEDLEVSNQKSIPKRDSLVFWFYFGIILFVIWRIVEMSGFVLADNYKI